MRPLIKRSFGMILTETPFNAEWVTAVKQIIPLGSRKFEGGGCWQFDPRYYLCVKTITEHFFGNTIIDSTGGIPETQVLGWKENWAAYIALSERARQESDNWRKAHTGQRGEPVPRKPVAASAYATLYVTENAPREVIIAAHRALASTHHPDRGGDTEVMARINAAFQELKKKGRV